MNPQTVMWKSLLLFSLFCFVVSCSSSDDSTIKETRALLDKSVYYVNKYDGIKSLEHAQKALKLSRASGNNELLLKSLCAVGEATAYLGLYEESLKYIEEAAQICPPNNIEQKANIYFIKGWCYAYLGFTDKGLEAHYAVVKLLAPNQNKSIKLEVLLATYQHIVVSFYEKGNVDSIAKYEELSAQLIPQIKYTDFTANLFSTYYFNRSQNALDLKRPEESLQLLNAISDIKTKANSTMLHIENIGFGSYYEYKNDNQKALKYYLKAIADIEKYKIAQVELVEVYKMVSELYGKFGDSKREKEFIKRYIQKKEELAVRNKQNLDHAINVILKDRLEEKTALHNRTILILSVSALVVILFVFVLYRKSKTKRMQVIQQLRERDETVEELQQQVGTSFEELAQMVKKNDSQFWSRFQEVHPKFLKKMLAINDKLTVAELTMAAYHFLGFSTKDIAHYTFKSLRTIEGLRYRMRKKLSIPPEENFIIWIRNYMNEG